MSTGINLQKEVDKILTQYEAEVREALKEVVPAVAKEAAKKLRKESPKKTGEYAKGWTAKVETGRVTSSAVVYGKKGTYPLAHLLEHGHAKRNGGRVAPIAHIKPVEEWTIQELQDRVKEAIGS